MTQVRVFEDSDGFHFQAYEPGTSGNRQAPALCGQPVDGMRSVAWFPVGDKRGAVHYDRAHSECRRLLRD